MPLPQAVLEQDRIADELIAADQKRRQEQVAEPEVVAPVAETVVAPVTEPVVVPAADPAPAPEVEATWERKYHTLNGKYLAEVPRLHALLKERDATIKKLTDNPPKPAESLLTPDEIEKYGPEFMDMVARAATQRIEEATRPLHLQIEQLTGARKGDAEESEARMRAEFLATIGQAHSDWETIDQDPKFLAHLSEYDPVARNTRQALLDDALAKHDSAYVISLLTGWKASNKARPTAPVVSPEPSTSRADPPPEAPKKIWTQAEIQAFYKKMSKGGYTDAEGASIEQEIQAAINDHRVR